MSLKDVIKVVAGLIVALICWWFARKLDTGARGEIFGILSALVAELIVILLYANYRTKVVLEATQQKQATLLSLLQDRIASEDLGLLLRYHDRKFSKWQMPEVWVHLLCGLRQTYCATNYIDPKHIYDTDWGEAALNIQNGKMRAYPDVSIRKVFLIDDESEIAVLRKHLEKQRGIGINIHYVRRSEVDGDPELSAKLKGLPSIDFGIFDNDHVLAWKLEGRRVVGGWVLFGSDHVKRHQEFFDALYRMAANRGGRVTVLPLCDDPATISHWPPYKAPYEELDYALRSPSGWLYSFGAKPGCEKYGAHVEGELVGFCLLDRSDKGAPDEAEFYVAIHPDKLNQGFGKAVTVETLRKGFHELGLRRIYLKVRKNHYVGIRLYKSIGFVERGELTEEINGKKTEFYKMEITESQFSSRQGQ